MEPSHQARKIISLWLLGGTLAAVGLAGWWQFSSPFARTLAAKKDTEVYLAVMTQPALLIRYNPATEKALVREVSCRNCKRPTAQDFGLSAQTPFAYYQPQNQNQDEIWESFKTQLENWRFFPLPLFRLPYDYLAVWLGGRTNLNPAGAILVGLEISKLEMNDFTLQAGTPGKKRKTAAPREATPEVEDRAPLAVEDRPIVVEVLNASGKRGLALALTQYLRDQNEKGQLHVDVLQYDNYPGGYLEETRIVDYSGRLMQVKQLSTAIGCRSEIRSEPRGNAICDTRIILGKDFEMP